MRVDLKAAFSKLYAMPDIVSKYPIHEIYLTNQSARYEKLVAIFKQEFSIKPSYMVRSPGRVNIIGEHIDYSGFAVLPMALQEQDIIIAVAASPDSQTRLANTNSAFPRLSFTPGHEMPVKHDWSSYIMGAYKVTGIRTPLLLLVSGNVPSGAGVSSSAALTCASVLALFPKVERKSLVKLAILAEHAVGMHCGGMDQSISVYGEIGSACMVYFRPSLHTVPIPLVTGCVFVVANSLIVADKVATADIHYNLRLAETKIAAAVLDYRLWKTRTDGILLSDFVDKFGFKECLRLIDENLCKKGYSLKEAASELEMDDEMFRTVFLSDLKVKPKELYLFKRAIHVVSEAFRVQEFKRVCSEHQDGEFDFGMRKLGQLMNESQDSCRDYFDCSCTELDELIIFCRSLGAYGSRLTGAGWGGCTVSLLPSLKSAEFVERLKIEFYTDEKLAKAGKCRSDLEEIVFFSKPGLGASIVEI